MWENDSGKPAHASNRGEAIRVEHAAAEWNIEKG
jgi:hypothetical protein